MEFVAPVTGKLRNRLMISADLTQPAFHIERKKMQKSISLAVGHTIDRNKLLAGLNIKR